MADARRGTSGTAGVGKWSKWSFGHLVKIDFGQTENATIIIKIYFYYYSEQKRTPRNENDQNDLDHFDHFDHPVLCLFLKKVDSIFTLKINISISVRNQLTLLAA